MAKTLPKNGREDLLRMVQRIAWGFLAAAWGLVVVALISFEPADVPSHAFGVQHAPVQNWVGSIGAMIAYRAYLLLGPGVWVLVAVVGIYLVAVTIGRSIDQLVLRVIGSLIVMLGVSSLAAVVLPAWVVVLDHLPAGPGGLLAIYVQDYLVGRFNVPGSIVILILGLWVGAILAADQWVIRIPKALGEMVLRIADISRLRLPFPKLALAGWFGAGQVWFRAQQKSEQVSVRSSRSRRHQRGQPEPEEEEPKGLGANKSSRSIESVGSAEIDDPDHTESLGLGTGDKKTFDPQALRAKIKKLPIHFASPLKQASVPPREVDLSGYEFPNPALLEDPESGFTVEMEGIVRDQALDLEKALQQYRIQGEVVGVDSGPVITLFELRLAPGTKVAAISAIASDLARAIKAQNIRIVPNMAGKDTVGIEVPNLKKERVSLKELMTAKPDAPSRMKLPMFLGKDASGKPLVQDLAACPHMLIAGTTGSGKSVCINSIITSFLFTRRPDELKLVLVDPKMVELSLFKAIPHLMCPVVTEMSKAVAILEWASAKMDERYELLAEVGVRDIARYNDLSREEIIDRIQPKNEVEEARIPKKLPYIVFIVDELADIMITNKEVESSIVRIAQKARAVGIHLILATQRPQANVVTGLIKSNMPARIAFKVASGMDSRIVLDQKGGELLLGHGDMLFLSPRSAKLTRAQGTFVDDSETRRTVKFLRKKAPQNFEPQLARLRGRNELTGGAHEDRDPLFEQAVQVVLESQRGSVSLLQRRLTIGYSRASRLIEQMAEAGIIGEYKGSQAREVSIGLAEWEAMKVQAEADAVGVESGDLQEVYDAAEKVRSDQLEEDSTGVEGGEEAELEDDEDGEEAELEDDEDGEEEEFEDDEDGEEEEFEDDEDGEEEEFEDDEDGEEDGDDKAKR